MHRLLIAEDIPAVASHLEDLARDSGIDAIMIVDSIESARAAIEFAPEIAIIDLNLADGFTGPMIADELRRSCDTRIIYLTANPELLPAALHVEHRVLRKPLIGQEMQRALLGDPSETFA